MNERLSGSDLVSSICFCKVALFCRRIHFMQKPSECGRAANIDPRRNTIVRNDSETAFACATNRARSRVNVAARKESGASVLSADSTHRLLRLRKDD